MASPIDPNYQDRPTVSIVSEKGPLAKILYQRLLSQNVSVNIFAINNSAQTTTLGAFGGSIHRLTLTAVKGASGPRIVFISNLLNPATSWKVAVENDKVALEILASADLTATRKLFIFPRTSSGECNAELQKVLKLKIFASPKTLLLFVDSLLDLSLLENAHDPLYFTLKSLGHNKLPATPKYVYPLTIGKVSDFVLKSLLSLSFSSKTISLQGKRKLVAKIVSSGLVSTHVGQKFYYFATNESKTFSKQVSYEALAEMIRSYPKVKVDTLPKKLKPQAVKPKKELKKKIKKINYWWAVILSFFFFVFITTSVGTAGLFFGLKATMSGNTRFGQSSLVVSEASFKIGQKPWEVLSAIPYLGKVFLPITNVFELGQAAANLAIDFDLAVQEVSNFGQQVLSTQAYDIAASSRTVTSKVDKFGRDVDFFIANTTSNQLTRSIAASFIDFYQLTQTKIKLTLFSELLAYAPELLGEEGSKNYLLVYQDSRLPRPTGGVVSGIALVKLDSGKIVETAFMEVSEADALLNGVVTPPQDLQRFLQTDRWLLKDANWETDFPQSAARIEWFVDKEIGVAVDGVVTFDNEALRLMIGDRKLELNANDVITSANFTEKLSGMDSDSGFVLFKYIIEMLLTTGGNSLDTLSLYKALDQKHMQISLHDPRTQTLISKLNYSGEVARQECLIANCLDDFAGLIQAASPESEFASKIVVEQNYEIFIDKNVTTKKVTIQMENTGTKTYRSLVKVLGGASSDFDQVLVREPASQYSQSPVVQILSGRAEAASVVEIAPNSEKTLVFAWQERNDLDFSSFGQYNLFLHKMPGSVSDKVGVKIKFPESVSLQSQYPALTGSSELVYNTELAQDLVLRFSW